MKEKETLVIGAAQSAPVWLDRSASIEKICRLVDEAGQASCDLIAFGETFLPGYPFWLDRTDGARFDSEPQKRWYSHYLDQAVDIAAGHLDPIRAAAADNQVALYLGVAERASDRGGHTVYCSMVYIDTNGKIGSVHRKLVPTYEERLVWGAGDGHGLRAHRLGAFTLTGLNCWENWMPLSRAAMYAQGTNLHVAIWPGSDRLTRDITRFIAMESRSFVLSAGAVMRVDHLSEHLPKDLTLPFEKPWLANGGSCIAAPDGSWLIEPQVEIEGLFTTTIHMETVRRERQNFDPVGHYSRPDVTRLHVDRSRQNTVEFKGI